MHAKTQSVFGDFIHISEMLRVLYVAKTASLIDKVFCGLQKWFVYKRKLLLLVSYLVSMLVIYLVSK